MRFHITKKNLVGVILVLCALLLWIFLAGCGGSAGLRPPGTGAAVVSGTGGVLHRIALSVTALAGIALVGCAVAAWFPIVPKRLLLRITACCLTAIVASQLLLWIGVHINAIVITILVLAFVCLGIWCWRYLGKVERFFGIDFNRNGKTGA